MKNNRKIEVGQVREIPKGLYPSQKYFGQITQYVILSYNSHWVEIKYLHGKYINKRETIPVANVMKEIVVM